MRGTRTFYDVLGVPKDASEQDVRAAYRRLAIKHHPDKNPGDAKAEETFKELAQAYAVLSDPKQRRAYDRQLEGGFAFEGWPEGGMGGFGGDWQTFSVDEIESLFGSLWGEAFGRPRRRVPLHRRGRDQRASVSVEFRTAALGGAMDLLLPRADGGAQRLAVQIPEGTEDGATLRLRGMGDPGLGAGGAGDLLLRVEVRPDPVFRRRGRDVEADVRVPAPVAVLGGRVRAPTLRGEATVTVPPGTSSGAILRLRGQGIRGGDHMARVLVTVPERPTEAERDLYRRLGDLARPSPP